MIALLAVSPVLHAEERRPTRGERLALEGRCEVAVPELEKELEQVPAPESAHVAWRLGQCALRARDYARAASMLEQALAIDPGLTEANLDLARARYHARDLDGADAALRAGESLSGEALWQLYRGMVDLDRGDAKAAVVALQRAVDINKEQFETRADPQAVEPVASYYLGIAQRAAGEEERARDTLSRVADSWAGTDWATQADRALGRTSTQRAWLLLGAGMEYDSNVILAGREQPLPEDISSKDDFRGTWLATGGTDLGRWRDTTAGVEGSYVGRAHTESGLHQFDSHFPTASLWLNQALRADTHVRLRYDFGYAWVGSDSFLLTNGGRLSLIHAWSQTASTELFGNLFADDYRVDADDVPDPANPLGASCAAPGQICGPTGLNERRARNRDGWGKGVGISHAIALPTPALPITPALSGGYAFTDFSVDGREYGHEAHRFSLGLGIGMPLGIGLALEGSYTARIFDHPSTFPDRAALAAAGSALPNHQYTLSNLRRREHAFTAESRLSVPLSDPFSVTAYYRYRDNVSTSDVFDYDQHIVGMLLNVSFARMQ
jgi:tetratricopeptide (TPR) repeat protein